MTTETINELVECLELALKNFQQDTLPRPAQIKRMREAVAAARAEMQQHTSKSPKPVIKPLPGFPIKYTPLPPARAPRPVIKPLKQVNVEYTPLPWARKPRPVFRTL